MNFETVPAAEISFAEQARIINAVFEGYVGGWHDLTAETLTKFLCLQGADIFYSRFVRGNQEWAGLAYISRNGNILRLATMGIVPSARGSGASSTLINHLFEEMRSRGDKTMTLEVVQQNPRAVALYRRHHFRQTAQLIGWRLGELAAIPNESLPEPEEIPVALALNAPNPRNYPEIPMQVSRFAIAKVEGTRAFRVGDVCVVIGNPTAAEVRVHGFFSQSHNWENLRAALTSVIRQFPECTFFTPPVFLEEYGTQVFEPLGFAREPISQFYMRYDL